MSRYPRFALIPSETSFHQLADEGIQFALTCYGSIGHECPLLDIQVINAGISGSTTASARSRLKWYLRAKPAIMILALGGNDGLRGLNVENMKKKLGETIELARSKNIRVLLAGMQMPLNYGPVYTTVIKNAFFELSEEYQVPMIPFLLKDVGGVQEHNLEDGIHPNPEGHRIVMGNVLEHLLPMLKK